MRRSNIFKTQEVRKISQEEEDKSIGFLILWMVIIEENFQMEEKECKD